MLKTETLMEAMRALKYHKEMSQILKVGRQEEIARSRRALADVEAEIACRQAASASLRDPDQTRE